MKWLLGIYTYFFSDEDIPKETENEIIPRHDMLSKLSKDLEGTSDLLDEINEKKRLQEPYYDHIVVRSVHIDTVLSLYNTELYIEWHRTNPTHPKTRECMRYMTETIEYARESMRFCREEKLLASKVTSEFTNDIWKQYLQETSQNGPLSKYTDKRRLFMLSRSVCGLSDAVADGFMHDLDYVEARDFLLRYEHPIGSWFFRKSSTRKCMPNATVFVLVMKKATKEILQIRVMDVFGVGIYLPEEEWVNLDASSFKKFATRKEKIASPRFACFIDFMNFLGRNTIHLGLGVRKNY